MRDRDNNLRWRHAHYNANRVKILQQRRDWYAMRTEEQKAAHRATENARYNDVTKHVKGYHAARTLRYRRKLKQDVIDGYGGKCTCCGESAPEFLTVDHVNNDGKAHRISIRGKNDGASQSIYRLIRNSGFPPEFTVLCFNCNIARSLFGTCPHQRPIEEKTNER